MNPGMTETTQPLPGQALPDPSWSGYYRAGGVALIVAGLLFVAQLFLLVLGPNLPASGAAYLTYVAQHELHFAATTGIFIAIRVLYIVIFVALYLALRAYHPTAALVLISFAAASLPVILASLSFSYAHIPLARSFVSLGEPQRAMYLTSAELLRAATDAGQALALLLFAVITFAIAAGAARAKLVSRGVISVIVVTGVLPFLRYFPGLGEASALFGLLNIPLTALYFFALGRALYHLGTSGSPHGAIQSADKVYAP